MVHVYAHVNIYIINIPIPSCTHTPKYTYVPITTQYTHVPITTFRHVQTYLNTTTCSYTYTYTPKYTHVAIPTYTLAQIKQAKLKLVEVKVIIRTIMNRNNFGNLEEIYKFLESSHLCWIKIRKGLRY